MHNNNISPNGYNDSIQAMVRSQGHVLLGHPSLAHCTCRIFVESKWVWYYEPAIEAGEGQPCLGALQSPHKDMVVVEPFHFRKPQISRSNRFISHTWRGWLDWLWRAKWELWDDRISVGRFTLWSELQVFRCLIWQSTWELRVTFSYLFLCTKLTPICNGSRSCMGIPYADKVCRKGRFSGFKFALNPFNPSF